MWGNFDVHKIQVSSATKKLFSRGEMLDPETTLITMAPKSWRFDPESHDDGDHADDNSYHDDIDGGDDDVDNDNGDDNVDSPLARFGRRVPTSQCLGQTAGVAEKRKIQKIQDERKYNICITNTKTQNNAMYQ